MNLHNVGDSIVKRGFCFLVPEEYGAGWYQPGVYCAGKKVPEYTSLQKAYAAVNDSGHYTSGWYQPGGYCCGNFPGQYTSSSFKTAAVGVLSPKLGAYKPKCPSN